MQHLTFRSSRIIYYGPHACENCGTTICKMGHDFGGNAFTYPEGPIYPNTEWHPHVCDPKSVARHGLKGEQTARHPLLQEQISYLRKIHLDTVARDDIPPPHYGKVNDPLLPGLRFLTKEENDEITAPAPAAPTETIRSLIDTFDPSLGDWSPGGLRNRKRPKR